MKSFARLYIIFAILFFILGIIQCLRWYSGFHKICVIFLLNFLPAAAFLVAHVLNKKIKSKPFRITAILLSLILPLFFYVPATFGSELLLYFTAERTNVKKYDSILKNYWNFDHELVSHFPDPVPNYARDVRFSFLPGFLQGGAHIQLAFSASPEIISGLYERFSQKKTKSFFGGDTIYHMNMSQGMPTTFFYSSKSTKQEFPADYEIMIFDKIQNSENGWNHGSSHGVAISKQRNQIVYWAEKW